MLIAALVLSAGTSIFVQYRKAEDFQERSDCATYWLDKAKMLQEAGMKSQTNITEQSQLDLMEQIGSAYNCVTTPAPHSRIPPGSGSFGQHGAMLPHK